MRSSFPTEKAESLTPAVRPTLPQREGEVLKLKVYPDPAAAHTSHAVVYIECVLCGELGHKYDDLLDLKLSPAQRHVDNEVYAAS